MPDSTLDQALPDWPRPDPQRGDETDAGDDNSSHARDAASLADRHGRAAALFAMRFDEVDRVLHGHDLLGGVVGDLAAELLLERHHQLDRVQAVGAEIVDEAGRLGDLGLIDAKMLDHNLFNSIGDIAHRSIPRVMYCLADWAFGPDGRTGRRA